MNKMCQRGGTKVLTLATTNEDVYRMEYPIRGPHLVRAAEIQKEIDEKKSNKPFNKIIKANIGDCQLLGQKPITFFRQMMVLVSSPSLMDSPEFPNDVKEKAKEFLSSCYGSIGSYTDELGNYIVRKRMAEFIERRDGYPCDYNNIILGAGTTGLILDLFEILSRTVNGKRPGVMIPIPQYPMYSATNSRFNLYQIEYFLDESNNWSVSTAELESAYKKAQDKCDPRVLVVINPGNPTGQVLTKEDIIDVIKFAYEHKLVIVADEVYQENIWDENCKFHSFKKVVMELGAPYSEMELISFMSAAKGFMGECGVRGGSAEFLNLHEDVIKLIENLLEGSPYPNIAGQVAIYCIANPPRPGDESYDLYNKEKTAILSSMKFRANMVAKTLHNMEGVTCNPIQGAMYAFPQLHLPKKAIKEAKERGYEPDTFYVNELLENTGICVLSGNGFGQWPGTHHFRTTILPQMDLLEDMLRRMEVFHKEFMRRYK